MKKFLSLALILVLAFSLVACGNGDSAAGDADNTGDSTAANDTPAETRKLVVGASPSPHAEILEFVKPMLAEEGIELEIQEFTDYVLPNNALDNGDIDANFFQHEPYLVDFNAKNGTDLVTAAYIHFEPLGLYAGKSSDLNNIPENAQIGVPNDTTNEARALQLLEANGIITLDPEAGLEATPLDIVENPYNVTIVETEAALLPRALSDWDFAVINGNYAIDAQITEQLLTSEASDSEGAQEFANVIAVRPGDEAQENIQKLIAALQSDETKAFIEETYDGYVVPVF